MPLIRIPLDLEADTKKKKKNNNLVLLLTVRCAELFNAETAV